MKRRDFILSTTGLAAATVLPRVSHAAEVRPCGPSLVSMQGGSTVETTCGPSGPAPSWFANQRELTWVAVAGGSGKRILDVSAGQPDLTSGGNLALSTRAWTGGCVDQVRGELLFAANGGHADYAGNEVYACRIRTESPAWYRLTDRSPQAVVGPVLAQGTVSTSNSPDGQGNIPSGFAAMYQDGRMRAVHGWCSAVFAANKVWYPHQSSPSGVGFSSAHAWSFNRSFAGIPGEPGQAPLGWTNNAGPWQWLGRSSDGQSVQSDGNNAFGTAPPSALDPVTGRIWTIHESNPARIWASIDTTTGTIRRCNSINPSAANAGSTWSVVVADPSGADRWRLLVAHAKDYSGGYVAVLNLKAADPYAASAWSYCPVSNASLLASASAAGAVYHRASGAVLLGNPKALGANLVKLKPPTDGQGSYVSGGTWTVSTVSPAAGGSDPATGVASNNNGAYSKFNIIEDMGNGQSALVVCMEIDAPTYVFKLPVVGV